MGHIMTLQELKYIVALADCGHFGVYYSPFLEQATASSTAWFREHL